MTIFVFIVPISIFGCIKQEPFAPIRLRSVTDAINAHPLLRCPGELFSIVSLKFGHEKDTDTNLSFEIEKKLCFALWLALIAISLYQNVKYLKGSMLKGWNVSAPLSAVVLNPYSPSCMSG